MRESRDLGGVCFFFFKEEDGIRYHAFFFFKQKTAYEISACLVGSEMCIRDSDRGDGISVQNIWKIHLPGGEI